MTSCWKEAVSMLWIGLTGHYRLTYEDRAMEAEDQLTRLLQQLDRREESIEASRTKVRSEALALRATDKARCRTKLVEHKRLGAQLDRLVSYKDMVLQHIDALRNTELNKSLISTLQESSRTLKAMGITDGIKQAEAVVSDISSSIADVQELTSVLGQPVHVDEGDLEKELESMLEDEAPSTVSSMLGVLGDQAEVGAVREGGKLVREVHDPSPAAVADVVGT